MGSCLPIRLALDVTHVMGIWLINRVFQLCTHWPLDLAQRGCCFPFTNEVDFGFFLSWLEMYNILFLFKSLKSVRTKLSETPAGMWQRHLSHLGGCGGLFLLFPGRLGEDCITNQPSGGLTALPQMPPSPPVVVSVRCMGLPGAEGDSESSLALANKEELTHTGKEYLRPSRRGQFATLLLTTGIFYKRLKRKQNISISSSLFFRSPPLHFSQPSTIYYLQGSFWTFAVDAFYHVIFLFRALYVTYRNKKGIFFKGSLSNHKPFPFWAPWAPKFNG